jgi:GH24 family phage-related lysozyme (muramidase)
MTYQIDQAGVELIASFEGFVNGAYNDSEGFATAGYGRLLHRSPATAADHARYDGKGRAYFLGLLHEDIERVSMAPMRAAIHVPLNQNQINALASLAFNWGGGILSGHIGGLLNAKRYSAAGDYFLELAHPAILMARRRQERVIFNKPAAALRFPWLSDRERKWVLEYDRLHKAGSGKPRRETLRRYMHREAVKIRSAAESRKNGWEVASRRQRYHSLMARSS